jgi:periplasmic protein CpxP/Spy
MRTLVNAAALIGLLAGPAVAQENSGAPAAQDTLTGSSNSAVNAKGNTPSTANTSGTINVVAPTALEKGANSFTEGQAKARIESAGLVGVSKLHKDHQGIWRGTANRNGQSVEVGFDYKGNVGVQ